MIYVLIWLFTAWFLGLFGFDTMVINGMAEVFSMEITKTGYYFLFTMVALIKGSVHVLSDRPMPFSQLQKNKDKKANVQ